MTLMVTCLSDALIRGTTPAARTSDPSSARNASGRGRLDADLPTHREIEALLRACSRRAPTGVRNAAIITVAWRCGLRIGEILALEPKDLDLHRRTLTVRHGKGDRSRVVGIDSGTTAILERWLTIRNKRFRCRSAPVFCTLTGGPIEPSYIRHLLPRLACRAGIEKRIHAHGLRHRYAVDLVEEGAPITTVRDLLGHSSIAVSDHYLRRLGAGDAVDFARSGSWPTTPNGTE